MINYRYRILNKIGEGGSGEVFLVEDSLSHHRKLAMKILHSSADAHAAEEAQFQNEIASLLQLQHPGLVRMLDFGMVRTSPQPSLLRRRFFTMEYVEGGDILHAFNAPANDRGRLLKGLFLQVLHVLDYIHRRGVIHFDIKPANLLLVSGLGNDLGVPIIKLTDFGFSQRVSEQIGQSMRGTLEYTAPELLRRESYDHRIDLYSLGATFYHLLEGRCPFEAPTPVDLIKRILTEEPEFSVPADTALTVLNDVIRILLHKNPSERFGGARQTAMRLLHEEDDRNFRRLFHGIAPNFVGRNVERTRLHSVIDGLGALASTTNDQQKAIAISGREGMGKHALAEEAVRYARGKGVPVFTAEGGQREIPFSYMTHMMGLLQAETESWVASEGGPSPGYPHVPTLDDNHDTGFPGTGEWQQDRQWRIERHAQFLIECSEVVPYVILARANEIDAESSAAFQIVVRDVKPGRLLLLLTEDSSRPTQLSHLAEVLTIGELAEEEVVALCAAFFEPSAVGAEIGARLFQLYGGVPAVVVEAIRSFHENMPPDALYPIPEQSSFIDQLLERLPKNIDQFLVNRYEGLSREDQLLLAVVACCDGPAPIDLLLSVLPFERRRLQESLQRISAEGYISLDMSARHVVVRQAQLKSAIYSSIASGRQELHGAIADVLEGMPATFVNLQERAQQYVGAGVFKKASLASEAAAEEGMKRSAFQKSVALYRDAIRSVSSDEDIHRLHRLRGKLARALFQAGQYKEAIDVAKELIAREDINHEDRFALLTTLGISLSKLGEYAESRQYLTEAIGMATHELGEMQIRQELVGIDIAVGNFAGAERQCRLQLELSSRRSYENLHAAISTDLGIALFFLNRFDESATCFTDALDFYRKVADHRHIANAMLNIGNSMSAKGDHGKAIESWTNALNMSRQYGTLNQQAQIMNSLGIAHYKLKQFQKARELYNESLQVSERIDSKPGVAFTLTNLGEVCFAEGGYEDALDMWSKAFGRYKEMDDAQGLVETALQMAQVLLTLGSLDDAGKNLNVANDLMTARGLGTFVGSYEYLRGIWQMQRGEYRDARASLTRSRDILAQNEDTERSLKAALRVAECMMAMGNPDAAVAEIRNVTLAGSGFPQIEADAVLMLGMIARPRPDAATEKPLTLFKKGLDAIAKEPVTELSWKLSLEMAREFEARGQLDRAEQYLKQTKFVLQFFLDKIRSRNILECYLRADHKDSVLASINARFQS